MKSTISIFLVLICVALCFFGCSNVPKEPATTTAVNHSYANPYGETVAPPANADPESSTTAAVQYLETVNNVECIMSSYYVFGNSVATITDIKMEYEAFSAFEGNGYADVEIMGIGLGAREDGMKIGYTAYNAAGESIRSSFLLAKLEDVSKGDTVAECRFDFPADTVKIVFHDYVGE